MIQFSDPRQEKEPERNAPCPCGSKKKYKKCCLKKKEFGETKPDGTTILKLLYCLINGLKGASVIVTKRTVDERVPEDWIEKMKIQPLMLKGEKVYVLSIKQEKEPLIATPHKRIILPGQN